MTQPQLIEVSKHRQLFKQLDLNLFTVVELGVGKLTKVILKNKPRIVLGYGLNGNQINDNNLVMRHGDFKEVSFKFLKGGKVAVVASSPNGDLEYIKNEIIDKNEIENVIITVPKSKKKLFPEYEVAFELEGSDFSPELKGKHLVMKKGFV